MMNLFCGFIFCWCINSIIDLALSFTDSFSVVMEPSKKEFSDVFFTKTNVSLQCHVNISVDDASVSIYLNESKIFESNDNLTTDSVTRIVGKNGYRLQINNLTLENGGKYTCKVESQELGYAEDSFYLNVVSNSPQCVTHCKQIEESCQLLCYSRQTEYFKIEESLNMSKVRGANGVPYYFVEKSITSLNLSSLNGSIMYRCSFNGQRKNNSFCWFDFITLNATYPSMPLTTNFDNKTTNGMLLVTSTVSVDKTYTGGPETGSNILIICLLSALCCTLILALLSSFIVVCRKIRKHSRSTENDQSVNTTVVSVDQMGFQRNIPLPYETSAQSVGFDEEPIPSKQSCTEQKQNVTERNHSFYDDTDKPEFSKEGNKEPQDSGDSKLRPYEHIDLDASLEQKESFKPFCFEPIGDVTGGNGKDNCGRNTAKLDQGCDMIDNIVYEPYTDTKGRLTQC